MQKGGTAKHRTYSHCVGRVASFAAEFVATRVKPGGFWTKRKQELHGALKDAARVKPSCTHDELGSTSFTTQLTGYGVGKTAPAPNNLIGKHELRASIEKRATRSHRVALDFSFTLPSCPKIPAHSQFPIGKLPNLRGSSNQPNCPAHSIRGGCGSVPDAGPSVPRLPGKRGSACAFSLAPEHRQRARRPTSHSAGTALPHRLDAIPRYA
jgi:hypothetical protein